MSLPRDLDEIPEDELVKEMLRRKIARGNLLCDYCGRPSSVQPVCKFPARHAGSR